jgi:hypothetical protein
MSKITGQVFKVYPSKFKKGSYQIRLEDNPVYYNTRKPGPAEPGVTVTFEAEAYNEKQWDIQGDVTVVKASGPAAVSASGGGGNAGLQQRYQGALERAILFTELLVTTGAVDLSKVKAPAKVGVLEALIDKYTAQFYDDTNNLGAITRLETPDEDATPAVDSDEEE